MRYVSSASLVLPVDSSRLATTVRLRPTSALISGSACDSAASASRAARTCRCAASASSCLPTLSVRSASSKLACASARREARSVSLPSRAPSLP